MKRITLSFDNGPDLAITPLVLKKLERFAIKTTFFVIGKNVHGIPEARKLVRQAKDAGHWIGNHSYSHSTPLGELPASKAQAEILEAEATLGDLAEANKLFRPFGRGGCLGPHLLNSAAAKLLITHGYTCVTWNVIPRDWSDPDGWKSRAQNECMKQNWPLVVLHDIQGACLNGLDDFLAWLRDEEYEIHQDFPNDCLPILRGVPDSTPWLPDQVRRPNPIPFRIPNSNTINL